MASRETGILDPLTRAEIDLKALAHNYRELRRVASPRARMMVVVKADAYGHGAVEVSRTTLELGADYLAVARLSEAVRLREAGIGAPILILGYTLPEHVEYLVKNDIRTAVTTLETARILSEEAVRRRSAVKVHVKIDTGMGRLGIVCDELVAASRDRNGKNRAVETILKIALLPGLEVEGVFTHFANADCTDKSYARFQFALFSEVLEGLRRSGLEVPLRHAANSAATMDLPETHLDMVRTGISLYGLWPSPQFDRSRMELRPVMSVKSRVVQVKEVPAGFAVSYDSTYRTGKASKIATVPMGYGDGYSRLLSSKGVMLARGQRAPVIGRVCMDLTALDVTHIPDIVIGDEVVVLGRQGGEEVSADEIAGLANTINYEVVTTILPRVTRVYVS